MQRRRWASVILSLVFSAAPATSAHAMPGFTSQGPGIATTEARLFGVHEVVLGTGDGTASSPFDTELLVTFVPPSGAANDVVVQGFYDGGSTWRARLYVTEVGAWSWSARSADDPGLDKQTGSFAAVASDLRGKLRKHPGNDQRWATDDGRSFLIIADTSYLLFNDEYPDEVAHRFVEDSAAKGVTLIRAGYGGGYSLWAPDGRTGDGRYPRSNWIHDGWDYDRFDLSQLGAADRRLAWLLDNHPDVYIDLHILPKTENGGYLWYSDLTESQRQRTLEQIVARLAAWPQVLFLIERDLPQTYNTYQENLQMIREVGLYLAANDPWDTFRGANEKSRELHQLTSPADFNGWESYLEVQSWGYPHGKAVEYYYDSLSQLPVQVFHGEDTYERPDRPADPAYYYRRLFWSSILSGGGGTYGGKFRDLIPYDETGATVYYAADDAAADTTQLHGLDDSRPIADFFSAFDIDLADLAPDDSLAELATPTPPEGDSGPSRVQCAHRGKHGYLCYHPNAADGEQSSAEITHNGVDTGEIAPVWTRFDARVNTTESPDLKIDLSAGVGLTYEPVWYHPTTGQSFPWRSVSGGDWVTLAAPAELSGSDAVVSVEAVYSPSYLIGHRGGAAGSEGWGPENTLAVFTKCIANGVSIETDLNHTSDGQIILFHGGDLSVTTDGTGAPTDRSFDYVRGLDAAANFGWASEYSPQVGPALVELLDEVAASAASSVIVVADAHRLDTVATNRALLQMLKERALLDRVYIQVYDLAQAELLRNEADSLYGSTDELLLAIWVGADEALLDQAVDSGYFIEIDARSALAYRAPSLPPPIRFAGSDEELNAPGVTAITTNHVDSMMKLVHGEIPTVVITEPTAGAVLATRTVDVRTDYGDSDGSIVQIQLLVDGAVVDNAVEQPYALAWRNATVGEHVLEARVIDRGKVRSSSPVAISIAGDTPEQALLVVADSASPSASDAAMLDRMQTLGLNVTLADDDDGAATLASLTANEAVVVVSASVASSKIADVFRQTRAPIAVCEGYVLDDMGMTGGAEGIDYGTIPDQTAIGIVDSSHPLAAGLTGRVIVSASASPFVWGAPADGATVIATLEDDASRAAIFAYDRDDTMAGLMAPHRRVALFPDYSTPANLTPEGWKLFDAAILWAVAGGDPHNPDDGSPVDGGASREDGGPRSDGGAADGGTGGDARVTRVDPIVGCGCRGDRSAAGCPICAIGFVAWAVSRRRQRRAVGA